MICEINICHSWVHNYTKVCYKETLKWHDTIWQSYVIDSDIINIIIDTLAWPTLVVDLNPFGYVCLGCFLNTRVHYLLSNINTNDDSYCHNRLCDKLAKRLQQTKRHRKRASGTNSSQNRLYLIDTVLGG